MPGWDRLRWWAAEGGMAQVAVVGAGVVGRGSVRHLLRTPGVRPALVVNRTVERAVAAYEVAGVAATEIVHSEDPDEINAAIVEGRPAVTSSVEALADTAEIDVVIEATGAVAHGIALMRTALAAGRHVISYNVEADALLGHLLDREARDNRVVYTIADGDQPSAMLRLVDEVDSYGLDVHGLLNCKRHLDVHQDHEQSRPYAARDGMNVELTTSAGDGTKMHLENVVVANLSGADPRPLGTAGVPAELATVVREFAALEWPSKFVHFTLGGDFGSGVLALASTDRLSAEDRRLLKVVKLGDGPLHPFFRPYHIVYLELATTLSQVLLDGRPIGTRTPSPIAECVAVAKADLAAGTPLNGIGSNTTYGVAVPVAEAQELLPIALAPHAVLRRDISRDQPLKLADLELDDGAELVRLRKEQAAYVAT